MGSGVFETDLAICEYSDLRLNLCELDDGFALFPISF